MMSKEKPENFNKRLDVVGCFVEYDDKFLILHRHPHKASGDTWGLPAGKKEKDESIEQALLREVAEETGIKLEQSKLKHIDSLYVRDGDFDVEWHQFSVKLTSEPAVKLSPSEHSEYRWVSPEEALQLPLIHDFPECIDIYVKTRR